MRSATFLILSLLVITSTLSLAGKNAGGGLIVHASDELSCTMFLDFCGDDFPDIDDCIQAETSAYPNMPVWLITSFPWGSNPGVSQIIFGIDHNLDLVGDPGWWGPCASFESPDPGWPQDPMAGNVLTFDPPIEGDLFFPFYVFCVANAELGNYLGTTWHPGLGYAAFVDDYDPPVLDECFLFGEARWFADGYNDCPSGPILGACCFRDGHCVEMEYFECQQMEGDGACQFLEWTECDPNPCPSCCDYACCMPDGSCEVICGTDDCEAIGGYSIGHFCGVLECSHLMVACCFDDGACQMAIHDWCLQYDGVPLEPGIECDPNPCIPSQVPDTKIEILPWGTIKALYR